MEKDINEIKENFKSHTANEEMFQQKLMERFDTFAKDLEVRFANKWVEKVVTFIITGIGSAIIGGFMYLLINHR